jgi:hypothetical protein
VPPLVSPLPVQLPQSGGNDGRAWPSRRSLSNAHLMVLLRNSWVCSRVVSWQTVRRTSPILGLLLLYVVMALREVRRRDTRQTRSTRIVISRFALGSKILSKLAEELKRWLRADAGALRAVPAAGAGPPGQRAPLYPRARRRTSPRHEGPREFHIT